MSIVEPVRKLTSVFRRVGEHKLDALPYVRLTLNIPCPRANSTEHRDKNSNQHRNDADDDEQLDQRKSSAMAKHYCYRAEARAEHLPIASSETGFHVGTPCGAECIW
jgi:hypothetical protein